MEDIRVCVRSVGDKQVYLCKQRTAAKHRPPRVWLRIRRYKKLQWHTAHANTHNDFVNHALMYSQSQSPVKNIPVNPVQGSKMTSNHPFFFLQRIKTLAPIFKFTSSDNPSDVLQEWNTSRTKNWCKRIHSCSTFQAVFFFLVSPKIF